uniref:Uncharacterized protein ycf35 n=1 Tax=Agarophyton chilense TaxID=2510777 RepID=A0A141SES3_AGACH|nr:hypothetical protein Gchil_141 [Agarophyton chilense]AMK96791.1 hypothetical protein Gchil_141 [Agarophyton chilense]ASP44686.1 hypothetical protein [Agarophyton chilense]UAD84279.1 hypothetical protein [Agarophyton chilense]
MSHFSRIKTSITNVEVLQKTLQDLKFECSIGKSQLKDSNGNLEYVDIVAKKNNKNIIGFLWNRTEYIFISDFGLWQDYQNMYPENIIEKILQQYAINSIIRSSNTEGFKTIEKQKLTNGSIKLVLQRWS